MTWWWLVILAALRTGPVDAVVATAKSYVGTPYVYGGASYDGVDCSGLVLVVYSTHGVSLPRTAGDQARVGIGVSRRHVAPGDLLFFSHEPGTGKIEHVGVAVDAEHMIHASTSRHRVVLDRLDVRYYQERLLFVRRVMATPAPTRLAKSEEAPRDGESASRGLEADARRGAPEGSRASVARRADPGERDPAQRGPSVTKPETAKGRDARCVRPQKGKAQGCLPRSTRSASDSRK